jgi:hypothetical protein
MRDEIEFLRELRPPAGGPTPEFARQARGELMKQVEGKRKAARWTKRRALPIAVPSLAAVAAAVVVAVTMAGQGGETAWAAALVRVADTAPRLLVDAPGWQVTRADEFNIDLGEMTFAYGERELELRWQPVDQHEAAVDKRIAEADLSTTAPVAGARARVFRYAGSNRFTALWVRGRYSIEVFGNAPDLETFKGELATVHEVDVDSWLSAMPTSVVKPASRADVAQQMLADIPQPAGFDAAALGSGDALRDRYQLGAQLTGAVGCAWIGQWVAAREAGDNAKVRQAIGAMATSHRWSILLEMKKDGAYPEVLWQYADAMATNAPLAAGKPVTVEESYRDALGCQNASP